MRRQEVRGVGQMIVDTAGAWFRVAQSSRRMSRCALAYGARVHLARPAVRKRSCPCLLRAAAALRVSLHCQLATGLAHDMAIRFRLLQRRGPPRPTHDEHQSTRFLPAASHSERMPILLLSAQPSLTDPRLTHARLRLTLDDARSISTVVASAYLPGCTTSYPSFDSLDAATACPSTTLAFATRMSTANQNQLRPAYAHRAADGSALCLRTNDQNQLRPAYPHRAADQRLTTTSYRQPRQAQPQVSALNR